ncbi:fibronectin type III domain protein [Granulicella sibirica]|uniref:Fibronectin type III domain protein n=1 Tax=Granulicella sibirica TaxID=2479048 RepID=A0A4Q0T8C3_9BACT|nr:fibronectin type III domain protein [Granulicella sibirica]
MREGRAALLNHYNPNQKLRLVLNIRPPHLADEDAFIKELTTKGSPGFHKFLSQDEWNTRFAPSAEDEQSVVDWAESAGLAVTKRFPNRLLVDVEATAGTIEHAFGVTMNNYQVGDEVDFANDRDPVIPSRLSGILGAVVGLNNIERVQRMGTSMPTIKGPDYVAGPALTPLDKLQLSGTPSKAPWNKPAASIAKQKKTRTSTGFGANDSYSLDDKNGTYAMDPANVQSSQGYDYNALQRFSGCCNVPGNPGGSPPESSIALVGYGNYNASDIVTFFQAYGMAANVTPYCIDGSTCPAVDGEAPLDVEYSGAMSNSYGSYLDTAAIYEYEMTNNYWSTFEDAYNDVLSDGKAKVVSTSYGGSEDPNSTSANIETGTMHSILNNMIASGITLIAASGDKGASADGSTTSVQYPSADPNFLAAGGTQLNLYTDGTFLSESAWQGYTYSGASKQNYGGSTGGRSVLFAAPYWQTMNNGSSGTYPNGVQSPYYSWQTVNGTTTEYVNTNYNSRLLPDLALTANPGVLGQWYYSGGAWLNYGGGTSIVAPELAGFFAQENSYLDRIGNVCGSGSSPCSPVGLASPFIYDAGLYGAPHDPFYDMTSGCNSNDVTVANNLFYYCAYTGYDPITGWGSANMMQLAWAINWQLIPAAGNPSLTFSGPSTNVWYNTDQIVGWTLSDAGSGNYPAPGALGFTQGWDSIPADSYSQPHGGGGDSFYTGPEFINPTGGCLSFNGASGCAGGNQGCHTAYVRGWDNQGRTTYASYGPVCVDTVAPTSSASLSGATNGSVYTGAVTITITSSDSTSGIAHTYYSLDGSSYTGYSSPLTIGATARGPHTLYYYSIDNAGNYSSVKSASFTISSITTTTLTSSLNPSIYGEAVTFKAAVTANPSGAPTGAVNFVSGSTVLGSANLTNGVASFTVANLAVGTGHINAIFVGNTSYLASSSSAVTEIINKANSTTAITSSLNPSYYGQAITFKATVTPSHGGAADGTVKFLYGTNVLGTATLSGNVASLTLSNLPVGPAHMSANYVGNNNIGGSNSSALAQVINKAKTTLALSSSKNPSTHGASVTFTAKVVAASGPIPTGAITFKSGSTVIGTGTLNTAGVAALAISTLPVGNASITADYGGSANDAASISAVLAETIAEAKTTTTITSSLNPAPHGTAITFTAKVVAASGAIPTGTVTFKNGSTVIGAGALNTAGVAALATSTLPVGTASITADYGGSANDVASASAVLSEVSK